MFCALCRLPSLTLVPSCPEDPPPFLPLTHLSPSLSLLTAQTLYGVCLNWLWRWCCFLSKPAHANIATCSSHLARLSFLSPFVSHRGRSHHRWEQRVPSAFPRPDDTNRQAVTPAPAPATATAAVFLTISINQSIDQQTPPASALTSPLTTTNTRCRHIQTCCHHFFSR